MRRIALLTLVVFCYSCKPEIDPIAEEPASDVWWNQQVFYEIFVRSFYDTNGDGIGDLRGVIEKLDYLNDGNPGTTTDLGVTGIWLMPIQPSSSYHGYDVTNYININSQYGTMTDFMELVDKAHARGIKVILDFVVNHTSDQHPWFATSAANSRNSDKRPYYNWASSQRSGSWYPKNGQYYYAYFYSGMPDLNYTSEKVTAEIYEVARLWDVQTRIDGYRMDAIPFLIEEGTNVAHTPSTLKWLRNFWITQKARNPSLMLVGEVWYPTEDVVQYTDRRMDYCFEFDLAGTIVNAVANSDVLPLKSKINQVIAEYPERQYGTFLSNHDQNRVIESLSLNPEKAKVAASILLTLPGIPYIYYGEEIGMRGVKPDEDIRKPMQWNAGANAGFTTGVPWHTLNGDYPFWNVAAQQADPNSIWNHYRKLINIRNTQLPLRQGVYYPIDATVPQIFSFMLLNGNDAVIAVHNTASIPHQVTLSGSTGMLPGAYKATDLVTESELGNVTVGAGGKWEGVNLGTIEAYSSRVVHLTQ